MADKFSKRLNGWQRIGVLLSVIWFVGFAWFLWTGSKGHALDFYGGQLRMCGAILDADNSALQYIQDLDKRNARQDENWTNYEKCKENAEQFYHRNAGDYASWNQWGLGLFLLFTVDLVIVAVAWLFAWLGVGVIRWIRRGFLPTP